MKALKRIGGVALVLAVLWGGAAAAADPPKPLSELDVLKLVELKIPDEVIAKRVAEGGVGFPAGDEVFARLKKAGASDAVMAAVKKAAKPAAGAVISLWVERDYSTVDNPLHSELTINDKPVGTFTSDTDRAVGEYLKPGWNTIALKTTPQPGATRNNHLIFRVGAVTKKDGKRVMGPVLWEFRNGTDWKLKDGKYTHQLGPDRKDVTLTFRVFYAGLAAEARAPGAGDYVLTGHQDYSTSASPVTGTVFVNGHEVSTFLGRERQVVITPYLKKGENTVKLVSARVPNVVANNDVKFRVGGPAEYNATKGRYELRPVVRFEAMQGWKRDPKTGQLVNQVKAGADTIEREVKFTLDEEPGKK